MVDRVLHELVEHDRERRRDLARQLAGVAVDHEVDREVGRRRRVSSTSRASGRTISLKRTTSPASRDSVSCTIAIERIRRSDSTSAARASGDCKRRRLEPQQRRDRLQVVLHPVVDLADRRVLRQQHAVAAPEVGDVAHEQQRARRARRPRTAAARAGASTRRRARSRRDRQVPTHRTAGRVVVEADVGQVRVTARRCGCPAGAARLTAFGLANFTRVSASIRITPSPTRGALSVSTSSRSNGNDPSATISANRSNVSRYVRSSSPVWRAKVTAASRVSSAIKPPGPPHRDALHAHPLLRADRVRVGLDELARPPAAREQRPLDLVDDGADEVLRIVGLAGDRPHLREHDEPVALFTGDRREQHQVGEREVGERPPADDEPLEVHEVGARPARCAAGRDRRACSRWTVGRRRGRGRSRRAPSTSLMSCSKLGHADDDVGHARQLGAQLGLAHRDDREVARTTRRSSAARARSGRVGERRDRRASASASASGPAWSTNVGRGRGAVGIEQAVGQRLVEHERAEMEARGRRSTAQKFSASYSGAASSVVTTANVVRRSCSSRSTALRALDEAVVHRLEVQEELGDVLEELAAEHAIGDLVEGPARDVDHAHARACRRRGTAA